MSTEITYCGIFGSQSWCTVSMDYKAQGGTVLGFCRLAVACKGWSGMRICTTKYNWNVKCHFPEYMSTSNITLLKNFNRFFKSKIPLKTEMAIISYTHKWIRKSKCVGDYRYWFSSVRDVSGLTLEGVLGCLVHNKTSAVTLWTVNHQW